LWSHEGGKNKERRHQLQVVGIESPAQGNGYEQAEKNGAQDGSGDGHPDTGTSHQRLPNDNAGQPPDHHANPHLHIGKTLILSQK